MALCALGFTASLGADIKYDDKYLNFIHQPVVI